MMHFTLSSHIQKLQKEFKQDKSCRRLQGIVIICVILLSSGSIYPVCANPLPTESSSLKVSELPFSSKLSNPCSLVNASKLHRNTINETDLYTKRGMINSLKAKVSLLKANAEAIVERNLINECPSLTLPAVAIIPTAEDISNGTPLAVLRLFYTSVLNHTAHVYFISEQLQRHSQDTTCHSPKLTENTKELASDMRELMCILRLSSLAIQTDNDEDDSFQDSTDQILNEELTDQPLCSRRVVRDCQTVGSTVSLLTAFYNFLQNTVFFGDNTSVSLEDS